MDLVASPADRATGQGALSPCRQGITSINGWSNNGANLDFWREILVPAYQPCRQGSGQMCTELIFGIIPRNFFAASGWVLCVGLHHGTDSFSHPKPFIFTEIMSPTGINRAAGLSRVELTILQVATNDPNIPPPKGPKPEAPTPTPALMLLTHVRQTEHGSA